MTKLKKQRQKARLKLRELACKLKITPQAVAYRERIGITRTDIAREYAQVLDCKPEDLIEW